MKKKRLVYGVGINDANYVVKPTINGKRVMCPFYRAWNSMLKRCFSEKFQLKHPTYRNVTVCKEWLSFMVFRAWMIQQEWRGNQLDKDLKIIGNKVYSPDTCMFVPALVNTFTLDCGASRGDYPIGVDKQGDRYRSKIRNLTGKRIYIGLFKTPELAHEAWRKKKIELANKLMEMQDRHEVKQGIANYIIEILATDYYLKEWKNEKASLHV